MIDAAELKKQQAALTKFYNDLQAEDDARIEQEAEEYAKTHNNVKEAYIAGYIKSIEQPHTKSLHLITMFALDFKPRYKGSTKAVVEHIRGLFRKKIHDFRYVKPVQEEYEDTDNT